MLVLFLFFIIVVGLFGYMIGKYVNKKKISCVRYMYLCFRFKFKIKIFYELNVFSDFKLKFF